VETAGLRELRQQASELVRQAESGQTIAVTVNGRAVAQLGPARSNQWRRGTDLAALFDGPADCGWAADRELLNDAVAEELPA